MVSPGESYEIGNDSKGQDETRLSTDVTRMRSEMDTVGDFHVDSFSKMTELQYER